MHAESSQTAKKHLANILIVDDEVNILKSVKRLLPSSQFTVTTASDVDVALETFRSALPDIVISDLTMPKMDGLTFLSQCRNIAPNVPRILMTGQHCEPEIIQQAINRAAVVRFLNKPLNPTEFLQAVHTGLKASGQSAPDEAFGRYQLLRRLAVGGMAEVYLAKLSGVASFSKQVVLKMMLPEVSRFAEFREMFIDEGRLAALLTHPNVGQVFDMGEIGGRYYIAMEFIDGEPLSLFLRKASPSTPLPLGFTLQVMMQLLDALEYVHHRRDNDGHALNLVHRDVTPSNVMITKHGHVKLVDFGIAKAATNQHRTRAGVVKGKFAYMSPEQTEGKHIDHRSDLFSVGALLYEMLVGQRAFDAPNDLDQMLAVRLGRYRKPTQVRPDLDPELEKIVMRALHGAPASRYASAAEFKQDLVRVALEHEVIANPKVITQTAAAILGLPDDAPAEPISPSQLVEVSDAPPLTGDIGAPLTRSDGPRIDATPSTQSESLGLPWPSTSTTVSTPWRAYVGATLAVLCVGAGAAVIVTTRSDKQPSPVARVVATPAPLLVAATPKAEPPPGPTALEQPAKALSPPPAPVVSSPTPVASHMPPTKARMAKPSVTKPSANDAPLQAPIALSGGLRVVGLAGTHVWLQGKDLGAVPVAIQLPAGRKSLTLINEATGQRQTLDVDIEQGLESEVEVTFR
ncbi:MAG: protein kinase [Myxococcaceae bacterium]|nr:protein kinase [Myxococcaceae bacterium]